MTVAPAELTVLAAPSVRKRGVRDTIRRHPTIVVGGALLGSMALMAIFAPYLGTVDPQALSPIRRLRWPSAEYWFGTDMLGRDIYSRTVYGARVSLTVGISVALLASGFGLAIGLVTGFSRWTDAIVMRIMDGLMSIPAILIAIALMALTRASVENVVFAITVAEVPRVTRLVRGVVLTLRELPFVESAKAVGMGEMRIAFRHVLPNTLAPLIVLGTAQLGATILIEATLSFLGLGVPEPHPSWGRMLSESAAEYVRTAPWLVIFPGVAISAVVFGTNLLGDAIRDVLDPRQRS